MTTLGIIAIVRTMLKIKKIKVCIKPFFADIYETMICYPLDNFLGLDKLIFKMSLLMMNEVSYWAQEATSFRRAMDVIFKVHKVNMSHVLVKKVKDYVGEMVYKKDSEEACHTYREMAKLDYKLTKKGTLFIEIDGSMVNTLEPGKDGSCYKEVKLAVIVKSDDIKTYKGGKSIVEKKVYVPNIGGVEEFRKYVFKAAVDAGCFEYEKTVIISDGAEWIHAMCKEDYPDAVMILDFYHVVEHIYAWAKYKFKEDEKKYIPYAEKIKRLLEESRSKEALECLAECEGKKLPEGMVNPYNYIKKNMDRIDYAEYRRQGFPIGSGMVECGNKIVNQRRCKQPGMKWLTHNAQTMLTLRAKRESGRWDTEVKDLLLKAA